MIIKGKEWKVIGIYPSFYLCKNELGLRECFLKTEIDGVPKISLDKRQLIYYIDDIPYTHKQIMNKYNLSYNQVQYRIHNKKELPDGKIIQVVDMQ
jgi:hypothetical protein